MQRHLDRGTQLTVAVTLLLFVVALFTKGFGHDLLLEAGVFLVSVKLVIMSYKASVSIGELQTHLGRLAASLERIELSLRHGSRGELPSAD